MDTIREKILIKVQDILEAVSPSNGFELEYKRVIRGKVDPPVIKQYPAIVFYDGTETASDLPHGHEEMEMIITVEAWVSVSTQATASKEVNRALGDIRKAMLADYTLGGTVHHVKYLGSDPSIAETSSPLGIMSCDFIVKYRTLHGDPYN